MDTPLPHRHAESPEPRRMLAHGRSVPGNGVVTFPASRPVLHDRSPSDTEADFTPDPDRDLPSERIVHSKLPTPPNEYDRQLAASVIAYRLECLEVELRNFVDAVRGLAETLKGDTPKDAA